MEKQIKEEAALIPVNAIKELVTSHMGNMSESIFFSWGRISDHY